MSRSSSSSCPKTSARNKCRTIYVTAAIYTSKRAARPGMVCYYFSFRSVLRLRRNSPKTTPKNPIHFEWGKVRHVINAARFTPPPQYIHQNVRLGREWCAITFLSDPRYHCDVISKKRRPKTPIHLEWGTPKKNPDTLVPHNSAILLPSNVI